MDSITGHFGPFVPFTQFWPKKSKFLKKTKTKKKTKKKNKKKKRKEKDPWIYHHFTPASVKSQSCDV